MSIEDILNENGMGSNISRDSESVSSPVPGVQGVEEKEEVQCETATATIPTAEQTDIECTDGGSSDEQPGRDNQQQPGESSDIKQPSELQHDGCRSPESRDTEFKPDGEFWKYIERQQAAWDRLHSKGESELRPRVYHFDLFFFEDLISEAPKKKKNRRKRRKNRNKKKWFKKTKNNNVHYLII